MEEKEKNPNPKTEGEHSEEKEKKKGRERKKMEEKEKNPNPETEGEHSEEKGEKKKEEKEKNPNGHNFPTVIFFQREKNPNRYIFSTRKKSQPRDRGRAKRRDGKKMEEKETNPNGHNFPTVIFFQRSNFSIFQPSYSFSINRTISYL